MMLRYVPAIAPVCDSVAFCPLSDSPTLIFSYALQSCARYVNARANVI